MERSSALTLGLVTGYFPWVKFSGTIHLDNPQNVLNNQWFIDIVKAEHFNINWRKHLKFVSNSFVSNMRRFWDNGSLSPCSCLLLCYTPFLCSNTLSSFTLVLLVITRLAHLWHMVCVPTVHSSFLSTVAPTPSVLLCLTTLWPERRAGVQTYWLRRRKKGVSRVDIDW